MSKYHRIKGKRCYDNANHNCNFTYWKLWFNGYFYAKRTGFKINSKYNDMRSGKWTNEDGAGPYSSFETYKSAPW